MDDMVFKALDDPTRRLLLDALFEQDGQSLGDLAERVPSMTRYGVMNHLSVLSAADLVVTVKDGRRKLHYLNPVPIQMVHERWITKYTERKARIMTHMKSTIEGAIRQHQTTSTRSSLMRRRTLCGTRSLMVM